MTFIRTAGICPLGALLTDKISENNGIFKVQYEGLILPQRMQMPSAACMQKNYVPTCIAARKCKTIKAMASPTVAAPKREKDPKKRVVITGMGLVSVFGSDIDTFYNKLLEGESGITLIDRFDTSSFPVRFGGQIRDFSSKGYIDGKNDRRLDDFLKYCLVAGKRALEDANLGNEVLNNVSQKYFLKVPMSMTHSY
jgi:3-oxoacyl-[acyl-carrier-protein] synthase II